MPDSTDKTIHLTQAEFDQIFDEFEERLKSVKLAAVEAISQAASITLQSVATAMDQLAESRTSIDAQDTLRGVAAGLRKRLANLRN